MNAQESTSGADLESTPSVEPLVINVGPLDGLGSFVFWAARPLQEFTTRYSAHQELVTEPPTVIWDLRNLLAGHVSVAALTALLAVAHRLRNFTSSTPTALFRWNPELFAFLEHTGFFRLLREQDLIALDPDVIGGYGHHLGKFNPATKFLYFTERESPPFEDREAWVEWKDRSRRDISERLAHHTGEVFRQSRRKPFPSSLEQDVRGATAELVLNSHLWGKSAAYVGVQRSGAGISVAVCDTGVGFRHSLRAQATRSLAYNLETESQALAVASLSNFREYGLRRVIGEVLRADGKIWMWSNGGEVLWRPTLWERFAHLQDPDALLAASRMIRPEASAPRERESGYFREQEIGIRGARIAFEIPVR